jgi:hypothetical protein
VPPLSQVGLSGGLVCQRKSKKEKARAKHPLSKVDRPSEKKDIYKGGEIGYDEENQVC